MSRRKGTIAVGVILGVAIAVFFAWRIMKSPSLRVRHVISVESDPPGAHIWVNGQQMGDTPLHVEELFVGQPVDVLVKRAGYRPWSASFLPDQPVQLTLVLERLPPVAHKEAVPVFDAGAVQRQEDQLSARRLGGRLDENGQFVDPEIEEEMNRTSGAAPKEEPRKHPIQLPTTPHHQ